MLTIALFVILSEAKNLMIFIKFLTRRISIFIFSCTSGNEIKWYDFEEGLKKAKQENKLILLDISAKWCHYCNLMETTTYSNPEIIKVINQYYIPIKVDADLRKDINKNIIKEDYQQLLS